MENQDFKVDRKTVWVLVVGNVVLTIAGAIAKVQAWEVSQSFLTAGLVLLFSTWIIVFSDMRRHKLYHKALWMYMMFIFPSLAPFFYLLARKRLIRLGSRFGR